MKIIKKLLLISFVLLGLLSIVLWLCGFRLGHLKLIFSEPMELSVEEKAELHGWLQENAIVLNTIEAGSGFDDMVPLKAMIGDARIVSLGEASHLNRDFTRAKHRMVEFLVNEMDFRVFAVEATFAGALELNDYVLGGDGDPRRALGSLVYLAWNTEAFLDMVNWMREYNCTHEKKVKFYGFDNKPATGSAKAVYNYLRKTNSTKDYDKILSVMMSRWTANQLNSGPKEEMSKAMEEVRNLISYLEKQKGIGEQKEWSLALQHAKVLLQHLEFCDFVPNYSIASGLRDKHMAQNASWVMDHEDLCPIIQ